MKDQHFYILLGLGLLGVWYTKAKAVEVVKDAGQAINPVNPDNIFNSGVNSVLQAVTGEEHATLGTKIYEWLH